MAERFDVAARLAEGQPAVEHTQIYVQACHLLGYQQPDLTAHGSQVRDWYETEAGLDLQILDDDSAELRAAVKALDEALWLQRLQVTEIATAWTGLGADSATQFLQHHGDLAAELAARVRTAADCYAALRDNLWQLIDCKAATALAVDDRRVGERSAWLSAAHEVTAGSGERSAAEALIRQDVIPYVDNDIRDDWLTAMRSTAASVEAAYDTTVDVLSSMRELRFAIPGELGPRWQPVFDEPLTSNPASAITPPMPTAPDSARTVPAGMPAPVSAAPPPMPQAPPALADLTDPLVGSAGLPTGAGSLGGTGGLAGSVGGIVGKIVDGIGGLLGSLADGFSDPSGIGEPLSDGSLNTENPLGDDIDDDADTDDDDADAQPTDAQPTEDEVTDESPADDGVVPEEPAQNPPATSDSVGDPEADGATPPPDAAPANDTSPPGPAPPSEQTGASTPCEIAADELPQAGQ